MHHWGNVHPPSFRKWIVTCVLVYWEMKLPAHACMVIKHYYVTSIQCTIFPTPGYHAKESVNMTLYIIQFFMFLFTDLVLSEKLQSSIALLVKTIERSSTSSLIETCFFLLVQWKRFLQIIPEFTSTKLSCLTLNPVRIPTSMIDMPALAPAFLNLGERLIFNN